jgi:hypothetical protein
LGPDGVRNGGARCNGGRADAVATFADEPALDPMDIMPPQPRRRAQRCGAPEFEAE